MGQSLSLLSLRVDPYVTNFDRTAAPLDLKLSTPKALGGNGDGVNPEQLFASGYSGESIARTLNSVLTSRHIVHD